MSDLSIQVKAAVLNHLSTYASLLIMVPEERIFSIRPPVVPVMPFIKYGWPAVEPYEESCGKGSVVKCTLNVFANDEDETLRIAASIVEAMELFEASFRVVSCEWQRTQMVQEDQDTYHGIIQLTITATE